MKREGDYGSPSLRPWEERGYGKGKALQPQYLSSEDQTEHWCTGWNVGLLLFRVMMAGNEGRREEYPSSPS